MRIGLSGWRYGGWRGVFYPPGLPQRAELAYAAQRFPTIELNGSFYSLQKPDYFARWYGETPDGFVFAVKGSRFITHMLKLKAVETPLANFLASGVLRLSGKLGPILWQFPPRFRFDAARFRAFLALLPRDTEAALAIARRHDHRLEGRAWLAIDEPRPLRHAFEIRDESFRDPAFIDLLTEHNAALVVADTVEWPLLMDVTADFIYVRLHGSKELYVSGYEAPDVALWADRVRAWAEGRHPAGARCVLDPPRVPPAGVDVYVYFDNDAKVRAPADAAALIGALGPLACHSPPAGL